MRFVSLSTSESTEIKLLTKIYNFNFLFVFFWKLFSINYFWLKCFQLNILIELNFDKNDFNIFW